MNTPASAARAPAGALRVSPMSVHTGAEIEGVDLTRPLDARIAFWDNRATAHLAPRDLFDTDFDRRFYRVTLAGEVPRGVDGRESKAIEGAPIPALRGASPRRDPAGGAFPGPGSAGRLDRERGRGARRNCEGGEALRHAPEEGHV